MITIITGGTYSEREASLATAQNMQAALKRQHIEYQIVDIADPAWLDTIVRTPGTVALIALHGTFGEDVQLQEILEAHRVPFTGSSSAVSRLAFDKRRTKMAVQETGIAVPREFSVADIETADPFPPLVIKPSHEGSSVGVSLVSRPEELAAALETTRRLDSDILIEERIMGQELTCAVADIGGTIASLPIVEIRPKHAFFDYESKYVPGMAEELCPAPLPEEVTRDVQRKSEAVFSRLGIRQYCRIDWILSGTTPYFIEVNTIPGMTPTSLINQEIAAAGLDFDAFIVDLVSSARS